jgi:hypothetical protein
VPHYFGNLSPVLGPADLPGVPHGALQPGALLLEQRMGFIRELQYRGIGRCRVPANSQQQFDRCPARELVEIDAGQFAKFRCGGSVLSLAHSLEPLTAGHDLPPVGSFPLRNLLGVDLTKLMLAVRPAAGVHTARDHRCLGFAVPDLAWRVIPALPEFDGFYVVGQFPHSAKPSPPRRFQSG